MRHDGHASTGRHEDRGRARLASRRSRLRCSAALLAGAGLGGAPDWLDPVDLSKPGRDASQPGDRDGRRRQHRRGLGAAEHRRTPSYNLQISTRAPGGAFTAPRRPRDQVDRTRTLAMTARRGSGRRLEALRKPRSIRRRQLRDPGRDPAPRRLLLRRRSTVYTRPGAVIPQDAPGGRSAPAATSPSPGATLDPDSGFDKPCALRPERGCNDIPARTRSSSKAVVRPAGGAFTRGGADFGAARSERNRPRNPEETEAREKAGIAEDSAAPPSVPRHGVDAAGNVTVVWSYFNGTDSVDPGRRRPPGRRGAWRLPVPSSPKRVRTPATPTSASTRPATRSPPGSATKASARMVQRGAQPPAAASSPARRRLAGGRRRAKARSLGVDRGRDGDGRSGACPASAKASCSPRPARPAASFGAPVNSRARQRQPAASARCAVERAPATRSSPGRRQRRQRDRPGRGPARRRRLRRPGVAISRRASTSSTPSRRSTAPATPPWSGSRDNGIHGIIQVGRLRRRARPELRDLSVPAAGDRSATPVSVLGHRAFDAWPVGPARLRLRRRRERRAATAVSHAYSAPGTYTVTVLGDGRGRATTDGAPGRSWSRPRNFFTLGKLAKQQEEGDGDADGDGRPDRARVTVVRQGRQEGDASERPGAGTVKMLVKADRQGPQDSSKKKGKLKAAEHRLLHAGRRRPRSAQQQRVTLRKKLG